MDKRGQVTIFVIIALVIVGVIVLIFFFPNLNVFASDLNPSSYLKNCISSEIEEIKETLSNQGGYETPGNYAMYQDMKLQYLCYTSDFYVPCLVQQPLLLKHVENEIKNYIEPRAEQCLADLKGQYEKRGFDVSSSASDINVSIVPGNIVVEFIAPLTISKESTQTFRKFAVSINSEWYGLINTAVNIIQYESLLGDSETSLYITYYPNLIIEKTRRDDGSTIYQLKDITTDDKFAFASRSLVWPQGYI
jgi:hypothetical protein